MKELFLLVAARLKTVTGIKWIDLDKGQIDNFEVKPAINFPGALIKIEYIECRDMGSGIQQCRVRVTIRLVWDFSGHTDSTMSPELLAKNIEYFDFVQLTYLAFQGHHDVAVIRSPFTRTRQVEESRKDGLKVIALQLETVVLDKTAAK